MGKVGVLVGAELSEPKVCSFNKRALFASGATTEFRATAQRDGIVFVSATAVTGTESGGKYGYGDLVVKLTHASAELVRSANSRTQSQQSENRPVGASASAVMQVSAGELIGVSIYSTFDVVDVRATALSTAGELQFAELTS